MISLVSYETSCICHIFSWEGEIIPFRGNGGYLTRILSKDSRKRISQLHISMLVLLPYRFQNTQSDSYNVVKDSNSNSNHPTIKFRKKRCYYSITYVLPLLPRVRYGLTHSYSLTWSIGTGYLTTDCCF